MTETLSGPLARSLTLVLLHFVWQGLVLAMLYQIFVTAGNVRSAKTRYAAALLILLAMIVSPLATFFVLSPVPQSPTRSTLFASDQQSSENITVAAQIPFEPMVMSENYIVRDATRAASLPNWKQALEDMQPYLLLFWFAGVMLCGSRLAIGLVNVVGLRFSRTSAPLDLRLRCWAIARRLHLNRVQVFTSRRVNVAAAVGFFKPVVLLPASWISELPPVVLESIVAHELAHIRRWDLWVNLFQRMIETLLFYHPAVWWLSNRIRFERELCCDELAVQATGDRGKYVLALEQVGRLELQQSWNLSPAITGEKPMNLLRRIRHLLGMPASHNQPSWLAGLLVISFSLAIAGMLGIAPGSNAALAQQGDRQQEGDASPEGQAGERRSAEEQAGPRRSPEADAGPRRSPEAEAGPRRSVEEDAGNRDRNSEAREQAIEGFRPQTDREAALFQMILQLRREVASLRAEVRARGDRDGDRFESARPSGDLDREENAEARGYGDRRGEEQRFVLGEGWRESKDGGVFKAYDKNGDEIVSLDEWLAMTNGYISPARRELQTRRFEQAEPSGDGKFTPAEFIWWYSVGRHQQIRETREGERRDPASGYKDRRERGSGDGEARSTRTGPREGE